MCAFRIDRSATVAPRRLAAVSRAIAGHLRGCVQMWRGAVCSRVYPGKQIACEETAADSAGRAVHRPRCDRVAGRPRDRGLRADTGMSVPSTPVVVIVGGGFAGLAAAKALKRAPVRVVLIDRTNHHLFQPLL